MALAALVAVAVTLAPLLGGGDDGAGAGEPVPALTETPGDLPANLLECLEEQGLDTSSGIPHTDPRLHQALPACGQFEQAARKSWIEAEEADGYNPPAFFAICKADAGIVVVGGWETDEDHKAFERMGPHLRAVGMGMPDDVEHLWIARLGWDPVPAEAA